MYPLSVTRLRRMALGAALVVVVLILGSYGWKAWQAARARRLAPAVIPTGVKQQAAGFTFSRSEKGETLFTVRASRTKDFEHSRSLLEDVWITIYGKRSNRSDNIHTARCEYDAESGTVECAGEVVIDLEGSIGAALEAPAAIQRSARNPIHIETSGVSFNQGSGIAHTDRTVRFSFPLGSGHAQGLTYDTRAGVVELQRAIEIQVARVEQGQNLPITLRGSRLQYTKNDRRMSLEPPILVTQGARQLTAQNLSLYLNERLEAERAAASGGVEGKSVEAGRSLELTAAAVVGRFGPGGSGLEQLEASGRVHLGSKSPQQTATLDAAALQVRFDTVQNEAREILATGNARFAVELPLETRVWTAPAMSLELHPGGRELARGHSEGDSALEILPAGRPGERRRAMAPRFELAFDERSRLENFRALGGVRVEVLRPGEPTQTSRSDQLFALFNKAQGTLKEADQVGHFRFEEADRGATADRGHYDAASETVTLIGQPVLRDASTQTTARLIFVNQRTGDLQAEQSVRTTYFSSSTQSAGQVFRTGEPVHITADRLRAQRATSQAHYEGHCRMWQGENVIQAETVDLYQKERKVVAQGQVASLFLEARGASGAKERQSKQERRPVSIRAERLTYYDAERRGIYAGGVLARDGFGTMRAEELEIFFSEAKRNEPVEIDRALAQGKVLITQPGRSARGDRAEYFSGEEKIVLSGGSPTVEDEMRGSTTGRRLTFYSREDTILVDSGEGVRTLTRHRVER